MSPKTRRLSNRNRAARLRREGVDMLRSIGEHGIETWRTVAWTVQTTLPPQSPFKRGHRPRIGT